RDRIVYKVKSGDVLGSIAMRHRVRVADLKKWNNLHNDVIRTGQRLNIWVNGTANATVASTSAKSAAPSVITTDLEGKKTYVVQPGDTLWDISKKFSGLTIEKIKSLNKLANSKIQPGQKLIVGM
ncbi:MAG: LysM peptidoglycan-binding domain-containing protein, partial [Bacteroidota bacterium]|nr:LysM peptidoglycan-binding domain-containing protein [Bacteroidota bacterium]